MGDNRSHTELICENENLKGALISAKGIISCMEQRMAEAGLAEEGRRMKDEKEILQWSKQIIGMRRELRESAIRSEERIRELEQRLGEVRERAEKAEASLDRSFQDTLAYSQQIAALTQERDAALSELLAKDLLP